MLGVVGQAAAISARYPFSACKAGNRFVSISYKISLPRQKNAAKIWRLTLIARRSWTVINPASPQRLGTGS
jgi:hypothetical protein